MLGFVCERDEFADFNFSQFSVLNFSLFSDSISLLRQIQHDSDCKCVLDLKSVENNF